MSTPRVSVIIPAYNQADYLCAALESVRNQTFRDLETIVVDDESVDNPEEVVFRFATSDEMPGSLRYLWQKNQGLAGARNTGIEKARGEYVALLDSDDLWQSDYLERMLALVDAYPEADVFYSQVSYIDEDGQPLPQLPHGGRDGVTVHQPQELYQVMLRGNFLVPSTILMRRAAVLEDGLFDPEFRRLQDWELWLRMLKDNRVFVGTSDRLVRYRIHVASLSADPRGGQSAALRLAQKHFGLDDGQPSAWSAEKRRGYGGVYRYHALSAVQYGKDRDAAAVHLRKALLADPTLARDLSLFYELALGNQPIGQRGAWRGMALEENLRSVESLLKAVYAAPLSTELASTRSRAYGTAYQAVGQTAYNAHDLILSRACLLKALRIQPGLIFQKSYTDLLLRVLAGEELLGRLRDWRKKRTMVSAS